MVIENHKKSCGGTHLAQWEVPHDFFIEFLYHVMKHAIRINIINYNVRCLHE